MDIVYEYVNVSASKRLESLIEEKLLKLQKRYSFIIRADVFLKKDNNELEKQQHCGIRLSGPGPRIYASSDEKSFQEAINETIEDLKDILEKRKSKMKAHL
ncbi:ribosome hibernation-promoting factor, HPF/YfiA family [Tenacibaculum sp. M341]|uniref:ribosome hibernation-promoting factor, HPF/YfiA family n=1 Tax=Tenacibaculum sp. M341 TaxID=2530339 RepID=UPI00104E426C|nr:ribosome-associated translation inhibitor RaiA [Tenacibaculum sp. M341]TCI84666.1 ribosome-associated translation inhibitor RaiA [Tenacibaculum sp. M341]